MKRRQDDFNPYAQRRRRRRKKGEYVIHPAQSTTRYYFWPIIGIVAAIFFWQGLVVPAKLQEANHRISDLKQSLQSCAEIATEQNRMLAEDRARIVEMEQLLRNKAQSSDRR